MTDQTVTTNEILEFLQDHMVTKEEFRGLEQKVDGIEKRVDGIDQKVVGLEHKMSDLERKLNQTKLDIIDHLDTKLIDFKVELTRMINNGDHKLVALIDLLVKKHILERTDVEKILA